MTFALLAAAFWQTYNGQMAMAAKLQIAGGAFGFLTTVSGWWILASLLLAAVDFPISLPRKCPSAWEPTAGSFSDSVLVGDLSTVIPGKKAN